jgi:hypothetical protein
MIGQRIAKLFTAVRHKQPVRAPFWLLFSFDSVDSTTVFSSYTVSSLTKPANAHRPMVVDRRPVRPKGHYPVKSKADRYRRIQAYRMIKNAMDDR